MVKNVLLAFASLLIIENAYAQSPTFSSDIAQIVYDHCTTCHRPGEIAPFSLITFDDVATYGYSIQAVVNSGQMPPWPANPDFRHFRGELVLSDDELQKINNWVDGGMAEGDPYQIPPVPVFPEGSQLGIPDTVYTWEAPFDIAGNNINTYRNMVIPVGLSEDRFIRGIEFRPELTGQIHHADFYLDTSGKAKQLDDLDPGVGFNPNTAPFWFPVADVLLNWSPGMNPNMWPPGMGKRLPANSHIVVDIHYAPTDSPLTDFSAINIFFTNDSIREIGMRDLIFDVGNYSPKIPKDQITTFYGQRELTKDISLMAVSPHMHLLGDSMISYAVTLEHDTIPIVAVDYDFNWQYMYTCQYLVKIPTGSIIYTESTFNNTSNNPDNPNNPPENVFWGGRTEDEMNILFSQELDYMPGDEYLLLDSSLLVPTGTSGNSSSLLPPLSLFPNPATDVVKILLHQPGIDEIQFRLHDLSGRLIMEFTREPHKLSLVQFTFSVKQLQPGMYFLDAIAPGLRQSLPLMIN